MQTILGRAGHVFVRFTLFNFNSISVINAKNLDQVLLANLSSVNRLIYFYFFHLSVTVQQLNVLEMFGFEGPLNVSSIFRKICSKSREETATNAKNTHYFGNYVCFSVSFVM